MIELQHSQNYIPIEPLYILDAILRVQSPNSKNTCHLQFFIFIYKCILRLGDYFDINVFLFCRSLSQHWRTRKTRIINPNPDPDLAPRLDLKLVESQSYILTPTMKIIQFFLIFYMVTTKSHSSTKTTCLTTCSNGKRLCCQSTTPRDNPRAPLGLENELS